MASTTISDQIEDQLPYGSGANKIFGMENFGNTCYCNSILQCLYYSDSFRRSLLKHNPVEHQPKLRVAGFRPHLFTAKYEQVIAKKIREQGKSGNASLGIGDDKEKTSKRPSLFARKLTNTTIDTATLIQNKNTPDAGLNADEVLDCVMEANKCEALSVPQRLKIMKTPQLQNLPVLVTQPKKESQTKSINASQGEYQTQTSKPYNIRASIVVVGIPQANTLASIPMDTNPSPDLRKKASLINGPIINLDSPLRLPSENKDSDLLYALKDMYESMVESESATGVVSPSYFINTLKQKNLLFAQTNMHQDAHEFFNYLMNEIIESLTKELGAERNWCNEIFQGVITNETKCTSCETITAMNECFIDLSIDIPPGETFFSLSYSLNNFLKLELLSRQNKFYCNTCASLQEAVKTIKLQKLPEVLVINLKRFKYDEAMDKLVKLFDSISYPFKMRLFNTTDPNKELTLYRLYALVIHIGAGPNHGHYVAICKLKSGIWLLFDDETVEIVDDSYVMKFFGDGPGLASAYILFYCRSDEREDGEITEFGFNPNEIYNGENYHLSQQVELQTYTPFQEDTQSDFHTLSETNSFIQLDTIDTKRLTGGLFSKHRTKEEKNDRITPTKERKSWAGIKIKDKKEDEKTSANIAESANSNGAEKKKSLFGFKRKK